MNETADPAPTAVLIPRKHFDALREVAEDWLDWAEGGVDLTSNVVGADDPDVILQRRVVARSRRFLLELDEATAPREETT